MARTQVLENIEVNSIMLEGIVVKVLAEQKILYVVLEILLKKKVPQ